MASAPSSSPDDPIIIDEGGSGDDGGGRGAVSSSAADRLAMASSLTQSRLDDLCRRYGLGVAEQYSAVLPAAHQRACSPPPPGCICVFAEAVVAGTRVPLHGFFCAVLAHFGLAPGQMAPSGWRAMAAFVVLSHSAGVAPSLPVFRHFFKLFACKFKGWYYFRFFRAGGARALFEGVPPTRDGWQQDFFFLKSATPWPCAVNWGEPSKHSTLEPVLTYEELILAKQLLDVRGNLVDIRAYVSETKLAAAMITPSSAKLPPPITTMTPPTCTPSSASGKGMDLSEATKNLPVAKATQAKASGVTEKATKSGPSHPQPIMPLGQAHGSLLGVAPSSPGSSKNAATIIPGPSATPLPIRTTGMGMDPQVYDRMKQLLAAKALQAQASVATVKSELASDDTPSSGKKRKVAEDATTQGQSSTPAHASFSGAAPSPPGFSAQSNKITSDRDHDPVPLNMAHKPDGGCTSNWETARQMLQSIITPAMEQTFSAAKPSEVIASSYITALQLEEKHVAMEREVDTLRQELAQAKADLADAKKAAAEEVRSAAEAAVRKFQGSEEQVIRYTDPLAGKEQGMEDMKCAVRRRYPDLDLEQLDVPIDGDGAQ